MWLGCPLAAFGVELLQTHEPLLTRALLGLRIFHRLLGGASDLSARHLSESHLSEIFSAHVISAI